MARYFDLPIDLSRAHKGPMKSHLSSPGHQARQDTGASESSSESSDAASEDEEEPVKLSGFPHAPFKTEPAFLPARQRKKQRNLKRQHFVALNTVLHKCILEEDFARAGRALGLLLRFEIQGRRVDLRHKGLWGLGGEILLRREAGSDAQASNDHDEEWFTEKGFEDAKSFYERLILQYPYKKQRPQDVSAVHFYPAMFSLWIMHLQSKYKKALNHAGLPIPDSSRSRVPNYRDNRMQEDDDTQHAFGPQRRAKLNQINEIESLKERVQDLILHDPYDRDENMNRLNAEVSQWLDDLRADFEGPQ